MLRWPFRIVLYVFMYIIWTMVSLLVLTFSLPTNSFEAVNLLPGGWIGIAGTFFADLYFTQLKRKNL